MKVALVIATTVHGGGAERQIALLAEGLRRLRGWDVRLYSFETGEGHWGRWAADRGVEYRPLASRSRPGRVRDLARQLRAFRPDVVEGYLSTGGLYGMLAGALARVPVVLYGERNAEVRRERWMALALDWAAARLGSGVICNTRAAAEGIPAALRLPADRFHYVPNAFVPGEGPSADAVARARAELDPEGAGHLVVMVGNPSPRKDYPAFLDIARRVLGRVPHARFAGIGDGPDLPALREAAAHPDFGGRVAFPGARRDVPAILRAAAVFVHTGYLEGMSNAVLEACEAGLPVVAVDAGGHPEIVVDGVTGWLFSPGDTGRAAGRVSALLTDPEGRAWMGAQARQRLADEFSLDALVRRHAEIYEALVAARLQGGSLLPPP